MHLVSRTEELLLLVVWRLQTEAYGMAIREELTRATQKTWSIGGVYAPLHRLEKKGYVATTEGAPTPERGGRRKVFYQLTPKGKRALVQIKTVQEAMWRGLPALEVQP